MPPRSGGEASAAPASPARSRRRTSAAVGAVRPQPARSLRPVASGGTEGSGPNASGGIDAGGEQGDPHEAEDLQGPVADHDLLRRSAPAGVEEEGVAEDGHDEGDDREMEQDRVTGHLGLLEGPQDGGV